MHHDITFSFAQQRLALKGQAQQLISSQHDARQHVTLQSAVNQGNHSLVACSCGHRPTVLVIFSADLQTAHTHSRAIFLVVSQHTSFTPQKPNGHLHLSAVSGAHLSSVQGLLGLGSDQRPFHLGLHHHPAQNTAESWLQDGPADPGLCLWSKPVGCELQAHTGWSPVISWCCSVAVPHVIWSSCKAAASLRSLCCLER